MEKRLKDRDEEEPAEEAGEPGGRVKQREGLFRSRNAFQYAVQNLVVLALTQARELRLHPERVSFNLIHGFPALLESW